MTRMVGWLAMLLTAMILLAPGCKDAKRAPTIAEAMEEQGQTPPDGPPFVSHHFRVDAPNAAARKAAGQALRARSKDFAALAGIEDITVTQPEEGHLVVKTPELGARLVRALERALTQEGRFCVRRMADKKVHASVAEAARAQDLELEEDMSSGIARLKTTDILSDAQRASLRTIAQAQGAWAVGFEIVEEDDVEATQDVQYVYVLGEECAVHGAQVAQVRVLKDEQFKVPYLDVQLTDQGGRALAKLTQEVTGQGVAMVFGEEVQMTPVVREAILGGRLNLTVAAGSDHVGKVTFAHGLHVAMTHTYPEGARVTYEAVE